MSSTGNKAVITGGEGDLASQIARHLSESGMDVAAPGKAELDVTVREQIIDYFSSREIDLLICNAGMTCDQPIGLLTEKDWSAVMDVNLKGAANCAREAAKAMKGRGGCSIVLISSHSAIHPPAGQSAYAAAKAGLLGLMSEMAPHLGKHNIRINAILPGFLETKMTDSVREQRKQEVLSQHTLERFNTCAQVAAFIRFLHQEMPHTSCQVFQLDSRSPF